MTERERIHLARIAESTLNALECSVEDALAWAFRALDMEREHLLAVLLDSNGRVQRVLKLASGTASQVKFEAHLAVEQIGLAGGERVVFAHNHPHGWSSPSPGDMTAAVVLEAVCANNGLRVDAHAVWSVNEGTKYY